MPQQLVCKERHSHTGCARCSQNFFLFRRSWCLASLQHLPLRVQVDTCTCQISHPIAPPSPTPHPLLHSVSCPLQTHAEGDLHPLSVSLGEPLRAWCQGRALRDALHPSLHPDMEPVTTAPWLHPSGQFLMTPTGHPPNSSWSNRPTLQGSAVWGSGCQVGLCPKPHRGYGHIRAVRDRNAMDNALNIVCPLWQNWIKRLWPPKPTSPWPDWNFNLWIKPPKETWDKIKLTLLFNYFRSRDN